MHYSPATKSSHGFTLVEVLVIAPVVVLVIGGFIALMVSMVGDVMATRDRNSATYDTQNALGRIEQDARLSVQFMTTSGTLPTPQGSNANFQGTAAFSNANSLILGVLATDKNPAASDRQLIYYAMQPNPCGPQQTYNRLFSTTVIYFIKDGSLWRRTIVPPNNLNSPADAATLCAKPWQQNSCVPGYGTGGICQAKDSEILKNIDTMTVKYYASSGDTVDVGAANAVDATTIDVTLSTKKTTAGRDVKTSESIRATKLNAVPDTP